MLTVIEDGVHLYFKGHEGWSFLWVREGDSETRLWVSFSPFVSSSTKPLRCY